LQNFWPYSNRSLTTRAIGWLSSGSYSGVENWLSCLQSRLGQTITGLGWPAGIGKAPFIVVGTMIVALSIL
jgi:hypothetical protein